MSAFRASAWLLKDKNKKSKDLDMQHIKPSSKIRFVRKNIHACHLHPQYSYIKYMIHGCSWIRSMVLQQRS